MAEVGKILLMLIVGTTVGENKEVKNCWVIEEGSVSGDYKDDLMNKSGLNRVKRVKVSLNEEQIFGGDCRDGCMYK